MTEETDRHNSNKKRSKTINSRKPTGDLRRGWTTGACATAATKSALNALITGNFLDPVLITLPKGETPGFALERECLKSDSAMTAIIKDAGDDPDVTHGATIISTVKKGEHGSGIQFKAGSGVGTVTKPGLPIEPGHAAINPVPRKMMCDVINQLCHQHSIAPDFIVEISVPNGENIATKTWNPRLGITGGISILGTTGIVHPFSCASWIHSIHRGIDVARATGITHVLGATGSTSENAAQKLYGFEESAILDMGDFAGGLVKYLRNHPIDRVTIAGGFAKMTKLAQGSMDLHSARSQVDMDYIISVIPTMEMNQNIKIAIQKANTAMEALDIATKNNINLGPIVAGKAKFIIEKWLRGAPVIIDTIVVDRKGNIVGRA